MPSGIYKRNVEIPGAFKKGAVPWANRSGRYLRELTDWVRLCAKCHKAYDREELVLQFN